MTTQFKHHLLSINTKFNPSQQARAHKVAAELMDKAELVFIPSPGLSHLVSTVETAKLLLDRDDRLSITVLTMKLPNDTSVDTYTAKFSAASDTPSRLTFVGLPAIPDWTPTSKLFLFEFIDSQTDRVREIISNLIEKRPIPRLVGFVLDMFCMKFIQVARDFGLPFYVFFTSGAATLGLFQYVVSLKFEQNMDLSELKNSDIEFPVPTFSLPVPAKVFPAVFSDGGPIADVFLNSFKRIAETNGVVVNTFYELESYAIDSLMSDSKSSKVYPVGPILNLSDGARSSQSSDGDVTKWLDDQPENSVIFLCFGTMGSLKEAQVREIALALENSGSRFLWSLRKKGSDGFSVIDYEDFDQVLPEGFSERTKGIGKVIGWAQQKAVLAHAAVGGFVSHCGWNSTLESVWFGVPIATFPLSAEQQLNAFFLVKEVGMAEMITLDHAVDFREERPSEIVGADRIEAAIRRLMAAEGGSGVRERVKEMQKKARAALEEGGSSYKAQCVFIEDLISNLD
ncbi:hypothetical protein C2S53_009979 [Perilla frutescens var. hirtella]|uniref:Glycosyltransferase n=1 Tax=Perilla frutescens var. hirtella TaxID=608512 RepID=A0AAD4IMS0_PERFH|nr:hypothetical protein C2S53_009979 [Perilla frutescens var. hirtella]